MPRNVSLLVLLLAATVLALAGCGGGGGSGDVPYAVSGRVTQGGVGLAGVTISFSGGFDPVATGPDGTWSKEGLLGTVTITPFKEGCSFTPTSVGVNGARSDVDFAVVWWQSVGGAGFSAGEASYISLALDSNGTPYVAYQDLANGNKATVMKYDGTSWTTVGSAGFSAGQADYISLGLDRSGTPYVAYKDAGHDGKATVMKFAP